MISCCAFRGLSWFVKNILINYRDNFAIINLISCELYIIYIIGYKTSYVSSCSSVIIWSYYWLPCTTYYISY